MSPDVVIRVEGLCKQYRYGIISHRTLHKDLQSWWARVRGKEDPNARIGVNPSPVSSNQNRASSIQHLVPSINGSDRFWALRDISFEVKQGEVLGIIGKNGAGKSTLLKILSKVTTPTRGQIKIKGRIASLLEVGTGFHPELTGRENIFLNGAILGMSKAEIKKKFDEIVAFAEVEKFIDTPVKRYSSGMYVRLAFAVAAHLEPEILIVDEVLAVGDASFQKKCLGKMGAVAKEGRTVLFVSHNMGAVKKLCDTSILLENGYKIFQGNTNAAVDRYIYKSETNGETKVNFKPFQVKELDILIKNITLNKENDGLVTPFKPLRIDIEMEADRNIDNIGISITISQDDTTGIVFFTNTKNTKNLDVQIKTGKNLVSCLIDNYNLCSGWYWLGFGIDKPFTMWYYYELRLLPFEVIEVTHEPSRVPSLSKYGHVYLNHEWIYSN